ncbi:MAG: hypothetical protein K2M95_04940 [Clostridiales bacterium]|nr:hypothetical protein [Clostridiales bacterium]
MQTKSTKKRNKEDEINPIRLNTLTTRIVYWLFEALIASTMIASIVLLATGKQSRETQTTHIILCAVALVLYNIPSFIQWRFRVYVPSVLHIFTLLFITAHFILGEVGEMYSQSAVFDKILHATSGVAIATIGFSLVNMFNTSSNTHLKLSPFFVAFSSFCFALAIAVLWEIFEFASDSLVGTNMQRYIPPDELRQATDTAPAQGYGLIDTMNDIIVSTIAAFVVCVLGYVSLRTKRNLMNRFLLRKIPDYDTAIAEAEEAGDTKLVRALKKARAAALEEVHGGRGKHPHDEDEPPSDKDAPPNNEGEPVSGEDGEQGTASGQPAEEEEKQGEEISQPDETISE